MYNFRKGSTLMNQIYKEGDSTWGCKAGVLDVEDVENALLDLRNLSFHFFRDELAFGAFITRFNEMMGTRFHGSGSLNKKPCDCQIMNGQNIQGNNCSQFHGKVTK